MDKSFIKITRSLLDHWIFKRDDYLKAWIYILVRANWKDTDVLINADKIECKRGEFVTSIFNFSKDTMLTSKQVRTFWNLLEYENMIRKNSGSKWTKITVCKYEDYQGLGQTKGKQGANKGQQSKNSKEYKEEYNRYLSESDDQIYHAFVKYLLGNNEVKKPFEKCLSLNDQISPENFKTLMSKYPKDLIKIKVNAMENTNDLMKRYSSFYRTLNNWCQKG